VYVTDADEAATLHFNDPEIWELLTDSSYLVLLASAIGVVQSPRSEFLMAGDFRFCAAMEPDNYPECFVPEIRCQSSRHKVTLSRRLPPMRPRSAV
jgi:hypothetical protein